MGPRGTASLFPDRVVAQADRLLGGHDGAGRGSARHDPECVHTPAAEHDESDWGRFAAALEDDFDTPAALAVLHDWASNGQLELLQRGLSVFGLETLAERAEAPADVVALAARRAEARAARDFETSDRLRDELAALGWQMRDRDDGFDLVRA